MTGPTVKTANIFDLQRQQPDDFEYKRLFEPRRLPVASPALLLGPVSAQICKTLYGEFNIGATGVHIIRNGVMGAAGIALYDETALLAVNWNTYQGNVAESERLFPVLRTGRATRKLAGYGLSICGPGTFVYGHWLVDFLPRLYAAACIGFFPRDYKIPLPAGAPGFTRTLLKAVGVPDENIVLYDPHTELLQFDHLIVTDLLRTGNRMKPEFRDAVNFLFGAHLANLDDTTSPHRKIFLSRKGVKGRSILNSAEIEAEAEKRGFFVVEPSILPFDEQMRLFRDAQIVMGEYGSALHNSIFSRPGTMVVALRGTAGHPMFMQTGICDVLHQQLGYVFGETKAEGHSQEINMNMDDIRLAFDWLELRYP